LAKADFQERFSAGGHAPCSADNLLVFLGGRYGGGLVSYSEFRKGGKGHRLEVLTIHKTPMPTYLQIDIFLWGKEKHRKGGSGMVVKRHQSIEKEKPAYIRGGVCASLEGNARFLGGNEIR